MAKKSVKKTEAEAAPKGWVWIDLPRLIKATWNYKLDDEKKRMKLAANIRRNGQLENIIIRDVGEGQYEVVNGNHRLDVFHDIGSKQVMCYNLGIISEAAAQRIAVETNETRFPSDDTSLATVMANILQEFGADDLLATMPFDQRDLDEFMELTKYEWPEPDEKKKSDTPETGEEEVIDVRAGDKWALGSHRLEVGSAGLENAVKLVYAFREMTGIQPVLMERTNESGQG